MIAGEASARAFAEVVEERDERERFRIYVLRGREPVCLATTPTAQGVGVALIELSAEGQITGDDRVGILDAFPEQGGGSSEHEAYYERFGRGSAKIPGRWLVNPFGRGRA